MGESPKIPEVELEGRIRHEDGAERGAQGDARCGAARGGDFCRAAVLAGGVKAPGQTETRGRVAPSDDGDGDPSRRGR